MKSIKTVIALVAVALTLGMGACKSSNPADEFASALDKLAKETESIKDEAGVQVIESGIEAANEILKANSSYELTSADKETIKKAMSNYLKTAYTKAFDLQGIQAPADQIDMMVSMATASIDKASTLGELTPSNNSDAPAIEEEVIEEVGEAVTLPDSIAVPE